MPGVTSVTLDEWLQSYKSADILHNYTVVNARLAGALALVLNNQQTVVSEITDRIEAISKLMAKIRAVKVADATNPTSKGPLGGSYAESILILEQLKAYGIPEIDAEINLAKKNPGTVYEVSKTWLDQVGISLQGVSESESNKNSQESLRLQTFTSRYSTTTEQASSVQQKNAQNKSTVVSNIRS